MLHIPEVILIHQENFITFLIPVMDLQLVIIESLTHTSLLLCQSAIYLLLLLVLSVLYACNTRNRTVLRMCIRKTMTTL